MATQNSKELLIQHVFQSIIEYFKYTFKQSTIINPRRACAARFTVLVLCVCLFHRANLRTGASRRLTEGTSGLSGTFFTKV